MGGYDIPTYVRSYLREWKAYDRLLRARWSQDEPGRYILERKTRYIFPPHEEVIRRGSDRAIQLNDGYRKVFSFWPNEIRYVGPSLRHFDIQRLGGAKQLARDLTEAEAHEEALLDRARVAEFEAITSHLYDRHAWAEKRRVSMAGVKTGA